MFMSFVRRSKFCSKQTFCAGVIRMENALSVFPAKPFGGGHSQAGRTKKVDSG